MAIKLTDSFFAQSIVLALLPILSFLNFNGRYPIPFYAAIGLVASGVSFGMGAGSINARRWLVSLEKKGELRGRNQLSTLLMVFGAVLVIAAAFLMLAFLVSFTVFTVFFDFASPLLPAFLAMETSIFRSWERKHKKYILQSMWPNVIFVYPYP